MFRRSFIQRFTLASASVGIAAATAVQAGPAETVTYRVKGFSCVTCAVGLDTMLQRQKGVIRSKSSYPDATTVIEFDPKLVTEKSLLAFIAEMGFTAEPEGKR
jgi:copper chaperone CopZ